MFLEKLFEKRSNVALGNSTGTWFYDWATGGKTNSGKVVNEITSMQQATVFTCVRIIAETIASLDCRVYRRLSTGGKELAINHPLYSLLRRSPNPEMTAFSFWETLVGHLLIYGNAYAEIVRDGSGKIVELWPLLPNQTILERDERTNKLYYRAVIPTTNEYVILPFEKVLHISGLGFDGRKGYNPIAMMRETLGLTLSLEEYGARYFGNGAKPGGVLESPSELSPEAYNRLKVGWNEIHSGLSKSHRIAILEQGIKYVQTGLAPEDSQFLESRGFQKREIAQLFRVPLHMLGDLEKSSYASIEAQSIDFVQNCIRPWLERIESASDFKLVSDREKDTVFVEFNVNSMLRGDSKTRNEVLQIQRQNGVISANEWRESEDRNPSNDQSADMLLMNGAMVAANSVLQQGGENNQKGTTNPNASPGNTG